MAGSSGESKNKVNKYGTQKAYMFKADKSETKQVLPQSFIHSSAPNPFLIGLFVYHKTYRHTRKHRLVLRDKTFQTTRTKQVDNVSLFVLKGSKRVL